MKLKTTVIAAALAAFAAHAAQRPQAASAELERELNRYKMTCGECRHKTAGEEVTVRWVMHKPRATSQKLPVLVFLPGLGELGPDLARLFRNRSIFNIVTSAAFQKKHPCVFVALQTEAGVDRHNLAPDCVAPSIAAMSAALEDALSKTGSARIDRERIYLTGLSAGGGACCSMMYAYPGRFAAAFPIAGLLFPNRLSKTVPENIWMMYNSGELNRVRKHTDFNSISREMAKRGGDFRVSELTGEGHNAWDAAWREDAAWDWMFSKRAKVCAGNRTWAGGAAEGPEAGLQPRADWKCTASARAESEMSQPRFGADGLAGTVYRSAASAKKGDWWQVEFPSPCKGTMKILTGDSRGKGKLLHGSVMVSPDGQRWTKAVAVHDGAASFRVDRAVKIVRLVVDANQSAPLVVRELEVR